MRSINHVLVLAGLLVVLSGCVSTSKTFATPELAIQEVGEVAGSGDQARIEELFGVGASEVLMSGDDVQDRQDGMRVKQMIQERVEIEDGERGRKIAAIGNDRWPLPVPLVRSGSGWRFDLNAGKEEIINRRVGRNELSVLATLHAYVDAQKEYRSVGRDGKLPAYAQKVRSSPGLHDGLYWDSSVGGPPSPLGALFANAAAEGYDSKVDSAEPFHGYHFRILTAQGAKAHGGAKNYVDAQGLMTHGFAAIAWPASYGNSGIMTFQINHLGIVFQKDLGSSTEKRASEMTEYQVDSSWSPTHH